MTNALTLTINGRAIRATPGASLLEAAEAEGVVLPHDCRSGTCEACRVTVTDGIVDDAGTRCSGSVLACRARVTGAASITFDPAPREIKTTGMIRTISELTRDIVELRVEVQKMVPYLPGQYVKLAIGDSVERNLCPTLTLDGLREMDELVFHLRRYDGSALGPKLERGRRVKIRGPFGQGFLRQGSQTARNGRIILVSSGTGFAPIWSIAVAARLGQPDRPLVVIASARDPRNLYMRPALSWLAQHDVGDLILTASGAVPMPPTRHGRASDHLPALVSSDTVHVAGMPELCAAIQHAADKAKAACHAIPFVPAELAEKPGIAGSISRLLGGGRALGGLKSGTRAL